MRIRPFTAADLPVLLRLKTEAGWNQTPADLQRFLDLQPDGSFVAEVDGLPLGTVTTFEFGAVGWIAMMLVAAEHRGKGIGRALMNQALAHLDRRGLTSIRLDATPLGRPLYEKLGFVRQFELARYAGIAPRASPAIESDGIELFEAGPPLYEALKRLDHTVTRTERGKLLDRLFGEQPQDLRIAAHGDQVVGYVTTRPGANARQIGPCLGNASVGPALLADAAARHAGETVFVDIPLETTAAVSWAEDSGLAVQRTLTRMCRGVDVREDLTRLAASSSPEKG